MGGEQPQAPLKVVNKTTLLLANGLSLSSSAATLWPSRSYNEHLYASLIMVVECRRSYLLHFATTISPSSLGFGHIGARSKVGTTKLWKIRWAWGILKNKIFTRAWFQEFCKKWVLKLFGEVIYAKILKSQERSKVIVIYIYIYITKWKQHGSKWYEWLWQKGYKKWNHLGNSCNIVTREGGALAKAELMKGWNGMLASIWVESEALSLKAKSKWVEEV